MRINAFVPAVLALSFFSASTQALPTPQHQANAVELLKRGGSNVVDALVNLFVDAETKVLLDACVSLEANVCADVTVKLDASANVLGGLVTANVDVKDLEVSAKTAVDADIKVNVEADVKAIVLANVAAHVKKEVACVCPKLDDACFKANAHTLVVKIVALIQVDVATLVAKIKADLVANAKVRVNATIKDIGVHLGLADVDVHAIIDVRSDIDAHLQAFVDLCASVLVNAQLIADVAAL
ncbi:hypothetical protein EMPS_11105 [Entomortierella parvispora]|uniref:Uncharacterized protein n=1 Tax=Entomortierella parvispora TaxID=205924 RepID=A0A9P3M1M8_9FUNG|nr:hypothetical protein EMPS_11105 [Entomortierella parvispora]